MLFVWLPVYDSVPVQEHQSGRDLGRVKTRSRLVELSWTLNLKHQVASVHVLHDEEQSVLKRERRVKSVLCFENVVDLKLSFQFGYIKKMLREKYEKKFLISSTIFDQKPCQSDSRELKH